mgnify:CR=1 FL=1|jgi:Predicted dehydrogenases and related proteins
MKLKTAVVRHLRSISLRRYINIDAVIIASENSKHREHTIPMIRSGKHAPVEKPIATSYRDSYEMVEEARKHSVKLQVGFVMRYLDASIEVKKRINNIGKIFSITATNHGKNPLGWFLDPDLAGGGAFTDHIVHVTDLIRWYIDREFIEVTAFKGRNIVENIEVKDNGIVTARLQDYIIASIDYSWSRPPNWATWGDVYMHIIEVREL